MKNCIKLYLACAIVVILPASAHSQEPERKFRMLDAVNESRDYALEKDFRTEFISYTLREHADKGAREKDQHYRELQFTTAQTESGGLMSADLDIPVLWLDRDIFLRGEGLQAGAGIFVNGVEIGMAMTGILPEEFNITPYVTDGVNKIEIKVITHAGGIPDKSDNLRAYVYSQPKLRIEDFLITAEPDSLNKYGILTIRLALANSYNFPEEINVGYDIYDPKGKLQYFDNRDVVVPGVFSGGRDTLEFKEFIYGTPANLWTPDKPALYYGMLIVKHGKRVTEYIPYRVGFGKTESADGRLVRNGKAVEVKAARYNAAADRKTTADELARLKKAGINTIMVDYPQPYWFYDLTDETGLYVFDQPDLNFAEQFAAGRLPGESPANEPTALGAYLYHTRSMFARNRNRTSIVGWSLGDTHGNGYNLYKTYQWLRENEPLRPVIYNGAEGEWDTDMEPIPAADARKVLAKPASAQNTRRR